MDSIGIPKDSIGLSYFHDLHGARLGWHTSTMLRPFCFFCEGGGMCFACPEEHLANQGATNGMNRIL